VPTSLVNTLKSDKIREEKIASYIERLRLVELSSMLTVVACAGKTGRTLTEAVKLEMAGTGNNNSSLIRDALNESS